MQPPKAEERRLSHRTYQAGTRLSANCFNLAGNRNIVVDISWALVSRLKDFLNANVQLFCFPPRVRLQTKNRKPKVLTVVFLITVINPIEILWAILPEHGSPLSIIQCLNQNRSSFCSDSHCVPQAPSLKHPLSPSLQRTIPSRSHNAVKCHTHTTTTCTNTCCEDMPCCVFPVQSLLLWLTKGPKKNSIKPIPSYCCSGWREH